MALTQSTPQPFNPGPALQDGSALNSALANPDYSVTEGQVTVAGQTTQALAQPVTSYATQFSSVVAGTAAILQTIKPGQVQEVYNDGGQTLAIYPPAGSNIDGAGINTSVNLSTGNRCKYTCMAPGVIKSALLGAVSS